MKIIIAGGRNFDDYNKLKKVCNSLLKDLNDVEIVSGGANGADKLGEQYANENNFKLTIFKADWATFGKSAGYLRNHQMAVYSDRLIAFWDGESKGTKHMIDLAKMGDLKVKVINYERT